MSDQVPIWLALKLAAVVRFQRDQLSGVQRLASFESVRTCSANSGRMRAAASRKAGGQSSSAGSGHNAAQMTARQEANGRRAHQICRVEMWPWRILFSRRACAEMRLMGRSTSIRRLG